MQATVAATSGAGHGSRSGHGAHRSSHGELRGGGPDGLRGPGFSYFSFFYSIKRGGLPTILENPPFTVTITQRQLGLTASVNDF